MRGMSIGYWDYADGTRGRYALRPVESSLLTSMISCQERHDHRRLEKDHLTQAVPLRWH